jgi:hypothetical protein
MNETTRKAINPLRRLAGNIVITIGVLWALLSGACTLLALAYALPDTLKSGHYNDLGGILAITFIPGGISIALGVGVIFGGRAIAGRLKGSK